jgi:transposase
MTALQITYQRIDDIPLLLAIMIDMGIPQQIDRQIKSHGHWQGISVGTVITIWLCYILTEHDHRLVAVREWVNQRQELFNRLLGIQLRDTDLTDDRLAICLTLLGDNKNQTALDQALVQDWLTLYELPTETTRHDSTTVSVYQEEDEESGEAQDSLIGYGHSKDHRRDLAQFKVMLSTLDPAGLPLTCQVVNGKRADDGLYIPSYESAAATLGHRRFLAVGDSKMGAKGTRAYLAVRESFYLMAFREPAADATELSQWVETALAHEKEWQTLTQIDERTGEIKTLAHLYSWERQQTDAHPDSGEPFTWTERVLVTRSQAMQAGLTKKREQARQRLYGALNKLATAPKRGRKRYRTEEELTQVTTALLQKYKLAGVITVTFKAKKHPDGGMSWRVAAYDCDNVAWQSLVDRLGWQIYLSNAPTDEYSDPDLVLTYRRQPRLERGISRLKSRNLHIRPVFLHDQQRICGLTWLLFLALRVIVLVEFRVRRELVQRGETIAGLNPASKTQATSQPTTERLLEAFGNIAFSIIQQGTTTHYHVTPLTSTQEQILSLLHLPNDVYLRLAESQPKPLFNLRE